MERRTLLMSVVGVAAVVVATGLLVTVAIARTPGTAVKAQVLDKSTADKWVEVRILEQTKGKTSLLGDRLIVRILSSTLAYNKSNAKQATASWLSRVQGDDLVSILGDYKSTDGTLWASKIVNRTR